MTSSTPNGSQQPLEGPPRWCGNHDQIVGGVEKQRKAITRNGNINSRQRQSASQPQRTNGFGVLDAGWKKVGARLDL